MRGNGISLLKPRTSNGNGDANVWKVEGQGFKLFLSYTESLRPVWVT